MYCGSDRMMRMEHNELKRILTFKDILILAFSTMIGWGWVSLTGTWVVQGGAAGAALAFIAGAVLCIFVGLTYSELTPMLPFAGGELVFAYKAMGYHASWFTGWMICFAYIGVAAWEGPALASAIDYLIPIPRAGYLYTVAGFEVYASWLLVPAAAGILMILVNYVGIYVSSRFQEAVAAILALGGLIFAALSFFHGSPQNAAPLITDASGVFSVVMSVPAMFVGFDVIPQASEEINLPARQIPGAIIASIVLAAVWYIIMIFSAAFLAPADILSRGGLTAVNAVNFASGRILFGKLIIVTAIMGILTSWNGFIIGATRILYSMGRAGMLPKPFGRLHPKFGTPGFSTLFVGIITILTPLLGRNSLLWFVDSSGFGTVTAYFMVALSFVILRIKKPELQRPFRVKGGLAVGFAAILSSLFFLSLYLPFGNSSLSVEEWTIVLTWSVLGIALYLHSFTRTKDGFNT